MSLSNIGFDDMDDTAVAVKLYFIRHTQFKGKNDKDNNLSIEFKETFKQRKDS